VFLSFSILRFASDDAGNDIPALGEMSLFASTDQGGSKLRKSIVDLYDSIRPGLFAYSYVPYNSMEGAIEQNKDGYYLALRRTQQTIRKEEQNWAAWLVFFLKTMVKQKDNLVAKVKEEQALRASLPALSRQILDLAKTRDEITVKKSRMQRA
jgi:hypothetical protein